MHICHRPPLTITIGDGTTKLTSTKIAHIDGASIDGHALDPFDVHLMPHQSETLIPWFSSENPDIDWRDKSISALRKCSDGDVLLSAQEANPWLEWHQQQPATLTSDPMDRGGRTRSYRLVSAHIT